MRPSETGDCSLQSRNNSVSAEARTGNVTGPKARPGLIERENSSTYVRTKVIHCTQKRKFLCRRGKTQLHPSSKGLSPKFPNMGSQFSDGNELKNLSYREKTRRRNKLLRLAKQAKKDPHLLRALCAASVGSLVRTDWYWSNSAPYIATHPDGWIYIRSQPGFAYFDQLLNQLIRSHSTFLLKLKNILSRCPEYRGVD